MNEEAMTPDKEQVVSPLSAPDEWRAFFRERGWVITMDDRPGQAFDAFVHIADAARTASVAAAPGAEPNLMVSGDGGVDPGDGNHLAASNEAPVASHPSPDAAHLSFPPDPDRCYPGCPHQTAARTASVAGLDERVAEAIYDAMRENDPEGRDHPWVPGGNSRKQEEARRRARAALNSAPSIEQEPGEHRLLFPPHPDGFHVSSALCSCGDWQYDHDTTESLLAAQQDVRRDHIAHIRAALREQEAHRDFQQARSLGAAPVPEVEGDPFQMGRSAPSIEQEPGDPLRNATDLVLAAIKSENPTYRTPELDAIRAALREQEPGEAPWLVGHEECASEADRLRGVIAALREQEPGETLRAAAEAALALIQGDRETRQGGAVDIVHRSGPTHWDDRRHIARCRTCNVEAALRAALEADRNPQETER